MTDDATSPPPPREREPEDGTRAPAEDASATGAAPETKADAPATKPVAVITPQAETHKPNYVFLIALSAITLVADLATKWWAKGRLEDAQGLDRRLQVIPNYFRFIFAKNRGGAWGLLQDEPESIRRPFFLGISVVAILFIVSLYRRLTKEQWALKWGLPLVLGGALGNLINRVQYNYVIDFIDIYVGDHHWPTFNVADIAIVVGVGLMAVDMFTSRKPAPAPAPAAKVADDED